MHIAAVVAVALADPGSVLSAPGLDGGKVIRIAVGYIDMHAAMDIAP